MTDERKEADRFARQLTEIFGTELVSVLLYGSAARGEYRPGLSDLNVLLILSNLDLSHMKRAAPAIGEWVQAGNPPPLMLSEVEWSRSADVFPIEYADMRDAHVVLAGRNVTDGMQIRKDHLRLQLEHELRSKKIQLREGYLAAGGASDRIGSLLVYTLPTFLTMFRALVRLAGGRVARDSGQLVRDAATLAGFDAEPVLEVLRERGSSTAFVPPPGSDVFAGYLAAVETATVWLDEFTLEDSPGDVN